MIVRILHDHPVILFKNCLTRKDLKIFNPEPMNVFVFHSIEMLPGFIYTRNIVNRMAFASCHRNFCDGAVLKTINCRSQTTIRNCCLFSLKFKTLQNWRSVKVVFANFDKSFNFDDGLENVRFDDICVEPNFWNPSLSLCPFGRPTPSEWEHCFWIKILLHRKRFF